MKKSELLEIVRNETKKIINGIVEDFHIKKQKHEWILILAETINGEPKNFDNVIMMDTDLNKVMNVAKKLRQSNEKIYRHGNTLTEK